MAAVDARIAGICSVTQCSGEEAEYLLTICDTVEDAVTYYFEVPDEHLSKGLLAPIPPPVQIPVLVAKPPAVPVMLPPPVQIPALVAKPPAARVVLPPPVPFPRTEEKKKEEKKEEEEKKVPAAVEKQKQSEAKVPTGKPKISQKAYTKHATPAARITNWIEVPIGELVAFCRHEMLVDKTKSSDYVCPICQMEYYDNMFDLSEAELAKQDLDMTSGRSEITVVQFERCSSHFYHKACAEHMAGRESRSTSVKCAVCGHIYGTLIGNMPPGQMTHEVYPRHGMNCAGYEDCGTIMITYSFPSGCQNGRRYSGTLFIYIVV